MANWCQFVCHAATPSLLFKALGRLLLQLATLTQTMFFLPISTRGTGGEACQVASRRWVVDIRLGGVVPGSKHPSSLLPSASTNSLGAAIIFISTSVLCSACSRASLNVRKGAESGLLCLQTSGEDPGAQRGLEWRTETLAKSKAAMELHLRARLGNDESAVWCELIVS